MTYINYGEEQQHSYQRNEQHSNNTVATTNNNVNNDNNIYLFNYKKRAKAVVKFADKMKFLNQIQKEPDYSKLSPEEEYELRNYILKNMGG